LPTRKRYQDCDHSCAVYNITPVLFPPSSNLLHPQWRSKARGVSTELVGHRGLKTGQIKCFFNKTIVRPQLYSNTNKIQDSK